MQRRAPAHRQASTHERLLDQLLQMPRGKRSRWCDLFSAI